VLNNLAGLYRAQGLFSQAHPLYERALAIREATPDKNHPDIAESLNNLANLYMEQGAYARAEPLYERALAVAEAALGKNHPEVAGVLNNLVNLYMKHRLYARAEPLARRALAIQEAAFGKYHPYVAESLTTLSSLYFNQGLYARAEPFSKRALAVSETVFGKKHPMVAQSLHNLASLYTNQRLYAQAEPLYKRALAIQEAAVGQAHPDAAEMLGNLAANFMEQGLYTRADPLLERGLAIQEAVLGKTHPDVALTLNRLARIRLAQHRLTDALPLFTRALAMSERRLRQEGLGLSESRLINFLHALRADEERLYTLLREYPDNASVRRLALGAALLFKGRSVEEAAGISRAVYQSLGAQDRDTFERLRELRTQLAKQSLQGPGTLPLPAYQQRLDDLAEQGDALEAELARRSAPLRARAALPSPTDIIDRVAAALPKNSALVELITYADRPLVPKPGAPKPQLRYVALILFPDANIRTLDLGPAEPIDRAALRLRNALASRDAAFQAPAQALYQLVFQPLLPLLGDTHRLFLSPDGQVGLVPFTAFHDGHRFLLDAYDFTYLTSGRDLLPRPQDKGPTGAVIVIADPDFGASPPRPRSPKGDSPAWAGLARRAWAPAPLPGTRQEAKAIQRLLPQAQLFLGAEATKDRLMHLATPSVLHLATHGFFLEDLPAPKSLRAVGQFGALGKDTLIPSDADPLLRSGLVFAGPPAPAPDASTPWQRTADNMLVTALELAGLNLWGTELVVLSACDTGRGDIMLGQGVYGLRRAFVAAGAETVVMSLWKVNDQTTSALMEAYYHNLLAGQGRATALREAMRSLRAVHPHPYYWAPFIALGQDAPLRALAPHRQEPSAR
jgi:CHAT domain-containing protein